MSSHEIEALKALQKELGLQSIHLVQIREDDFIIAHTDAERAVDVPLEQCGLH